MDYLVRTSDMEEELAKRFLSRLIEEYNGRVRMKVGSSNGKAPFLPEAIWDVANIPDEFKALPASSTLPEHQSDLK